MNPIQKHILKRPEIESMTDRELLEELVAEKRRDETWRIIDLICRGVIFLIVVIVLYIYLPVIIRFFQNLYAMVQSIKQAADSIQSAISEFSASFGGLLKIIQ